MPDKKKNNKQPKNAFFYFMEDFRAKEETCGRFYSTLAEVATAAGPEWQDMSAEERRPYEQKKEDQKKKKKEKKYTALGEDVAVRQRREEEVDRDKKTMLKNIEDLVADGSDFITRSFYVAHVNHYCYCNAQNRHIPAEISIVRFSLQDGIYLEDCFHVILDTGTMPIGYRLAAVTVSEESHLIPVPPHDDSIGQFSERNIRKAFVSMTEFLRKNLGPREYLPPVYVDDTNIEMAKDVFQNLHEEHDGGNVYNEIRVYSLSYLFFVLRNAAHSKVSSDKAFPFSTIPQAELEKDIYDYVKGIACEYHNTTDDAYPHCSLSKCIRKVFIICDHTCYDLNITLIPGRHVPKNVRPEKLDQRPSSQISWTTVSNSRPASSLSNGVRNNAGSAAAVAATASAPPKSVWGAKSINQSLRNESNTAEASALPAQSSNAWPSLTNSPTVPPANAKTPVRKPQSMSKARVFQPLQPAEFNNEFPALGSEGAGRPQVMGRGRGRILQQMVNNK